LEWKDLLLVAIAALALASGGCSGINASRSFSPASFFLPGLIQNVPDQSPSKLPDASRPSHIEVAKAN